MQYITMARNDGLSVDRLQRTKGVHEINWEATEHIGHRVVEDVTGHHDLFLRKIDDAVAGRVSAAQEFDLHLAVT